MRAITDQEFQSIVKDINKINQKPGPDTKLSHIQYIIKKLNNIDPDTLNEIPSLINTHLECIKKDLNKNDASPRGKSLHMSACKLQVAFNTWISQRMIDKGAASPENLKNKLLIQLRLKLRSFMSETDGYQVPSLQKNMNVLINDLIKMVDDFKSQNLSYEGFKTAVNNKFNTDDANKLKEPNSPYYELHYAVASVFRGIFRLFDLGWVVGRKTMNETYTPFAKTFTGNNHFFELPKHSVQKEMAELTAEVEVKIRKLDELFVGIHNAVSLEFKA